MLLRIANMVRKEMIQFSRDRLLALFILLAPMLQLVLLAQNTSRGIRDQPLVIVDLDHSQLSRQLAVNLDNTEELRLQFYTEDMDEMRRLLDTGQARLAVIIPAGFGRNAGRAGSPQQVQIVADGTSVIAASISMATAAGAATAFAADLAESLGLVTPEFIDFRSNVRFNPTLNARDFTIPAQLGFIVYQVTLAVASLGLARERELGTLEQLMVTPLRRIELAVGKAVPAVAIGMVNFAAMLLISRVLFQVPMNGSALLLAALTLLFVAAVANWGVALSSFSRTQQQAILLVFIQAMVEIALSGFLVPVKNLPGLLQAVSRLSPLQHYLTIVRGVMLKGAGWEALWPQVLALAVLGVAIGAIALRSVIRRLD
ncbi:MAG: ABC transporter permease [Anaerolineae bacterium]|nr:ABC transporter permease [Anaerolineae bacterium]